MTEPRHPQAGAGAAPESGAAPGLPSFRAPGVDTEGPKGGFLPGVLRFFFVPLLLVAASLAIFAGLGALVDRGHPGVRDLLGQITEGGKNARWQAAQELSNRVHAGEVDLAADPTLAGSVAFAFRRARKEGDDPRVVQHLAVVLGRGPAAVSRPALVEALGAGDPDVRIYVLAGLSQLADPEAVPAMLLRLEDLDPAVRAVAAYAIPAAAERGGAEVQASARSPLVRALGDPSVDVRWNAATGLARLGFADGADQVWKMLHRGYVRANYAPGEEKGLAALFGTGGSDPATPAQIEDRVVLNALSAAYRLRDRSMIAGVRRLASEDPSDSVRDWAMRTVEALEEEIARRGAVPPREWSED